jgi:hypothetical protein
VGAVLPASHLVRERSETGQRDLVRSFLAESIAVCEALA